MSKNGQAPTLALDELNELEALAYSAEAEPSDIRWQQAQLVAELNDEGISTRAIAAGWVNAETGEAYSYKHVQFAVRTWRVFGNLSSQHRPRWNTAYNSDEVRKPKRAGATDAPLLPPGKFAVIYADPPWRYEHAKTDNRVIENHYPTMTLEEICALPVGDLTTADGILFLWATPPKLEEAMQVIAAWGFQYRTCMVWVKDKIGMGYYARQRHELLLIARRGEFPVPEPENRPDSVIEAPRGEHSAKPPGVYALIERMYPQFSKVELFSRARREGWEAWGNQV